MLDGWIEACFGVEVVAGESVGRSETVYVCGLVVDCDGVEWGEVEDQ